MSISNPSHLLISRNSPRSPAHPQLAHASTSRSAHAHTHHHASTSTLPSSRPDLLGRWASHSADEVASSTINPHRHRKLSEGQEDTIIQDQTEFGNAHEEEGEVVPIDIHPTFLPDSNMPGNVKVIVSKNEFWCHKEVLWFASPFFQGLLKGNWAETNHTTTCIFGIDTSPEFSSHEPLSPPTDTDPPSPRHGAIPGADIPPPRPLSSTSSIHCSDGVRDLSDSSRHEDRYSSRQSTRTTRTELYLDPTSDPSATDFSRELGELSETPTRVTGAGSDSLEDYSPTVSQLNVGTASPRSVVDSPFFETHLPVVDDERGVGEEIPVSPWVSSENTTNEIDISSASSEHVSRSRHSIASGRTSMIRHSFSSGPGDGQPQHGRRRMLEAVVELHEESPAAFQDFLFWAYPHLECKVTWTNVENLLALSLKLIVPPLQKLCERFLMTHASGRPVMALCLAEVHSNSELYREASRFVLDQPTWDQDEMQCLSAQTQLKLSNRRNWNTFSSRLQAYSAVCRYGPPQPSVTFRCLRQLETFPTNPSLVMSHPLCQSIAKTWVMSLFDRMFQPKLVYSNPGTEKYWLWITMN
ncbi:uncharacterized protein I206_105991 [Kwoniella pini CBS 10737]|uniref:BTB domain-containing protein n=1 Tax=Kwoniella pini CBS 10737 TaxID=1296096 RepID=A0AAJ8LAE5_9TREE